MKRIPNSSSRSGQQLFRQVPAPKTAQGTSAWFSRFNVPTVGTFTALNQPYSCPSLSCGVVIEFLRSFGSFSASFLNSRIKRYCLVALSKGSNHSRVPSSSPSPCTQRPITDLSLSLARRFALPLICLIFLSALETSIVTCFTLSSLV